MKLKLIYNYNANERVFNMKFNLICKCVLALVLFAVAAYANGCHGVNW